MLALERAELLVEPPAQLFRSTQSSNHLTDLNLKNQAFLETFNSEDIPKISQQNRQSREAYARVLSRVNTLEEKKAGLEELATSGFIPELLDLVEVDKNFDHYNVYQPFFRQVLNQYLELSATVIIQDPETLKNVIGMITKTDEKSVTWLKQNLNSTTRENFDALYETFQFFADTVTSPPYNLDMHEINSFLTVFIPLTKMIGIQNINRGKSGSSSRILTGNADELRNMSYQFNRYDENLRGIKAIGRLPSESEMTLENPEFRFFRGKGAKGNHDIRMADLDQKLAGLNLDEYLRNPNGEIELKKVLSAKGLSPYRLSEYQGFELQLRDGRIIGAQIGSKIDGVHNLFYETRKDIAMVPKYQTVEKLTVGLIRSINPDLFDEGFRGITLKINPRTGYYPIAREGTRILSPNELESRIQIASINALSEMRANPSYVMPQYNAYTRTNAA